MAKPAVNSVAIVRLVFIVVSPLSSLLALDQVRDTRQKSGTKLLGANPAGGFAARARLLCPLPDRGRLAHGIALGRRRFQVNGGIRKVHRIASENRSVHQVTQYHGLSRVQQRDQRQDTLPEQLKRQVIPRQSECYTGE